MKTLNSLSHLKLFVLVVMFIALTGSNSLAIAGTNSSSSSSQSPVAVQSAPVKAAMADAEAAIQESNISQAYSAPARFLSISGDSFTPRSSATTYTFVNGCVYLTAGYQLVSKLNLPNNAHMVLLRLYYINSNASNHVTAWVTRIGTDQSYEDLVSVTSTTSASYSSSYVDLDHYVDTYNNFYEIIIGLGTTGSTVQFCGVRLMYYDPADFGATNITTGTLTVK